MVLKALHSDTTMELTDLITNTLNGHAPDLRLDAFTSGAFLVVATYYDEQEDTYDDYYAFRFHDVPSRAEAYAKAKQRYDIVLQSEHMHIASIAVTLDSTDY